MGNLTGKRAHVQLAVTVVFLKKDADFTEITMHTATQGRIGRPVSLSLAATRIQGRTSPCI